MIIDHYGPRYLISFECIFMYSTQCMWFPELKTYVSAGRQIFFFCYRRFAEETWLEFHPEGSICCVMRVVHGKEAALVGGPEFWS